MVGSSSGNDVNRIILHGGPRDGEEMRIPHYIEESGFIRAIAPVNPLYLYEMKEAASEVMASSITLDHIVYAKEKKYAGKPGTCEYREWYEWHYIKESK